MEFIKNDNRPGKNIYPVTKKILLIMKLATIVLIIFCGNLSATAYSQRTRLTLELRNQSIKEGLYQIESQSGFRFIYEKEQINLDRKVSMRIKNETVETILERLLENENVRYEITESKLILIYPAEKQHVDADAVRPAEAEANRQGKFVTGTVVDERGDPVVGANIVEKGVTANGTVTDVDGKFSLTVSDDAVLRISYIGYITQEISVLSDGGGGKSLTITLLEDTKALEEVVVIGYGTVRKSDLTGAVSSVSAKDLGDRVTTDIGTLLSGKVTGVDVSQGAIRIRGVTTLNNTDPLIIVDGFMGGSYNPEDIEHVEILKDASSTAIYGARGANGVILITTKSGKAGPLKVTGNVFTGFDFMPPKRKVLNASQYIDFATDAILNANGTLPPNLTNPEYRRDVTDWQDEVFKTGHKTEANFNFSGGTEKAVFSLSTGYRYSDGMAIGSDINNGLKLRSKNEFRLADWFKAGINVSFNYTAIRSNWVPDWTYTALPYTPVYDPTNERGLGYGDGNTQMDGTAGANPVAVAELWKNNRTGIDMQPNAWLEI
ncbi:MAG: SusC/RagA family TonB-linked outer membrane protein, partial [Tannerella sp.]|nr:SusC/RagA family TonB-linked outer membrane protein [Tannerella sp.]